LLLACLRSLARNAPAHVPFETIVVLNNANQRSVGELAEQVSGITALGTAANLGLPGSANYAYERARGEWIILLHDDAEVESGWMEALVAAADRHADAGLIGGKVLNPDGTLQSAGMILWSDATTSPPWIGPAPPSTAFDRPRAVDYCGTSSLLVRRSTWNAIGGPDEQFFPAYYVDADLAMGTRALGQYVRYEPSSCIRHHGGSSTGVRFRRFISDRNRERFRVKWSSALAMQEPPAPSSADAIERAIERCERARNGPHSKPETPTQRRGPEDDSARELRCLKWELALREEFSQTLEVELDRNKQAAKEANRQKRVLRRLRSLLDRHILWRLPASLRAPR
jgi:GT2 family glycosyltransferase